MSTEINKQQNHSPLIDRTGAAEYLGIRPGTLSCWSCNGRYDLPFIKVGRRVMYRIYDLDAFIARNTVSGGTIQ